MASVREVPITWQTVGALFEEAWPNEPQYPTLDHLCAIAERLKVIRRSGVRAPKRETPLEDCTKSAKDFLKRVAAAQVEIENRTKGETDETFPALSGFPRPPLLSARRKLDEAADALSAFLAACAPIPWSDPVQFIERYVLEAWASIPGNRAQLGRYAESPLVLFLQRSLKDIPLEMSNETISDHLRKRLGGGSAAIRARAKVGNQGAKEGQTNP